MGDPMVSEGGELRRLTLALVAESAATLGNVGAAAKLTPWLEDEHPWGACVIVGPNTFFGACGAIWACLRSCGSTDEAVEHHEAAHERLVHVAGALMGLMLGGGQLHMMSKRLLPLATIAEIADSLADLPPSPQWSPTPSSAVAVPTREPWLAQEASDVLSGASVILGPEGRVVVLGVGRLAAAEDAIRVIRTGREDCPSRSSLPLPTPRNSHPSSPICSQRTER